MNALKVLNYESTDVRMVEVDGEPWFVAADVCDVLGLSNASMVIGRLDEDERAKFNLGRQGETNIVNEYGLYNLILASRKPGAKQFKRWITHEVIPSIRKTGSYRVDNSKKYRASAMLMNARTRQAKMYREIAKDDTTPYEFKRVLNSLAVETMSGKQILPLPEVTTQRTYSAEQIGECLGISKNMVGRIAKANNLKTDEYGKWFYDKSRSSNKQVENFRYYESVIPVIQQLAGVS